MIYCRATQYPGDSNRSTMISRSQTSRNFRKGSQKMKPTSRAQQTKKRAAFRRIIRTWYRGHRRTLPWRGIRNAYRILVSEVMLQQTQVDRVIPKYMAFLKRFPTLDALARAP